MISPVKHEQPVTVAPTQLARLLASVFYKATICVTFHVVISEIPMADEIMSPISAKYA